MTITPTGLTKAAGLCAAASGLLYCLVQFVHPEETVAAVGTTAWAVTAYLTISFAVLGLIGVTGMYLRQVREAGVLGFIGYALFGTFFLLTVAFTFAEALILPELTDDAPQVVDGLLGIFSGEGTGDLGAVTAVSPVAAVLYLGGGLCFGIALVRARVLARWASLLLVIGTAATLAVPLVPHSVARYAAIPVGVALIGLGLSLWRDSRAARSAAGAVDAGVARPDTLGVR